MSLVCIITALPPESRVFIDALKLRHVQTRALRLYASDHHLLLQTGLGKLKAAAATGALLQSRPDITAVINAGVAGATADIGTVHLAHQIVDSASGMQWFPHLPPQRTVNRIPTTRVMTVDQPESQYLDGTVFDMEAAGIFVAASAYLSTDAMHSVKVVSDNVSQPIATFSPAQVSELLQASLPVITQLVQWHGQTVQSDKTVQGMTACCDAIQERVRHTVSERHQLNRLVQQYMTLIGQEPELDSLQQLSSARDVRKHLQYALQQSPLVYAS